MALENKDRDNVGTTDREALEFGFEVLKEILKSKSGAALYMDDPTLYNKINLCSDIFEFQLSKH
jgi:hypothetical protein